MESQDHNGTESLPQNTGREMWTPCRESDTRTRSKKKIQPR